jgi:hypothetical protein
MQKFKALRIVLIGTVLAVSGGLYAITRNHLALDRECNAFITASVVAIGSHWDTAELLQRATPQFREATKEADLHAEFAAANAALGPLVEYRAIAGKTAFPFVPGSDKPVTADYIVRAIFAKGEADIVLHTVRTGSTWGIDGFAIGASPEMRALLGMQG